MWRDVAMVHHQYVFVKKMRLREGGENVQI